MIIGKKGKILKIKIVEKCENRAYCEKKEKQKKKLKKIIKKCLRSLGKNPTFKNVFFENVQDELICGQRK